MSDMSQDMLVDDDSFADEQTSRDEEYLRKDRIAMRSTRRQRRQGLFTMFVILVTLFILAPSTLGIYYILKQSFHDEKPMIELCRMHYHEWKAGKDKDFLLEGEFYQQVEIDHINKIYEKLNVPSVMNSRSVVVLHDFREQLTAIIDRDQGRCLVMALNATLVRPLPEFYEIVKNIKAGYDSPDAEVIRDSYRLLTPAMKDVAVFGQRIFDSCRYFETYRLERDEQPLGESQTSECKFKNQQYCLGNAGTEFLPIIVISRCVQ